MNISQYIITSRFEETSFQKKLKQGFVTQNIKSKIMSP